MKNRSKALLLALCALMLVVTTVFTTLAYLTDDAAITNTFTVGNVAIKLDETKVDVNGDVVTGGEAGRVETPQSYKLIPNKTYTKDPKITLLDGSEDAYVFVKVVNGISGIEKATTIANQMAANNWVLVDGTTNVYQLKVDDADVVTTAGTTLPVFEQVNISGEVDADDLNDVSGETIEITAYAIQASGFTSAKQAWDAAIASGDITITP